MGPEPYSLAIRLAESMGQYAYRKVHIDATDIEETFGKIVTDGVYPEDQVKRIPAEIFSKYFVQDNLAGHYRVADPIRQSVHFQQHNLLSLKPIGEGYHLILCKNVLLHFQPNERAEVIKMFHAVLAPGGYFGTEKTQEMPEEMAPHFTQLSPEAHLFRKN